MTVRQDPLHVVLVSDDSTGNLSTYDETTGKSYPICIDVPHNKIHEGDHYYIRGFTTLGLNDQIDFVYTVPSGVYIHIKFDVVGTDRVELYFYEGTDYTGGTVAYPLNNNRNYADNTTPYYIDPTINDDGTLIWSASVGAIRQIGTYDTDEEIVLKPGETYMWRIISRTSTNTITYHAKWYEVS